MATTATRTHRLLDALRMLCMLVGATSAAMAAAHVVLALALAAVATATMIGLYELTHR